MHKVLLIKGNYKVQVEPINLVCTEVSVSMKEVIKEYHCDMLYLIPHFCDIKSEHQRNNFHSTVIIQVLSYIVSLVLFIFLKVGITRSYHK